ncbi:ATP-dependent helicase NAM7, partial [Pseudoloma neurophilia]
MPLCSYCTNTIVLRCFDCEQYFCHSFLGTVSSHIVFHLKKTKHNKVGNIVPFKCCKCSVDDVFLLGMLPPVQKSNYEVKTPESNVTDPQRIFCKTCNSSVIPLIQDRTFCSYFRQSEEEESFSSSEDIIFKNTENVPKISVTDQEENTEKITEKPTEIISNNRTINFETPYDYAQNFLKMLKKEHLVDKLIRKQLSLNNTIIEIRNNKIYFNNKGSVGDEIRVEIIDSCNDLKTFENEISEGHSNNFIESHSK